MNDPMSRPGRRRKALKPLESASLEELALAYVARFSTTATKLEHYLRRKLRERGWAGEGEPPTAALVERYVSLGYVDDEGFARARTGGLLRRGYGARRVRQALGEAGVAEELREKMRPSEAAARQAALTLARKRRFGPFAVQPPDKAIREKQLAAMLRAGHALDNAREILDAPSVVAAEEWVAEVGDETEY